MKLGDKMKELLEENNMTQRELAEALGFTPAALGNYIRNVREPDYNTLIQIAEYFHVSIDTLLNHNYNSQLNNDEELLLSLFRSMTSEQKEIYLAQGKAIKQLNIKKKTSPTG